MDHALVSTTKGGSKSLKILFTNVKALASSIAFQILRKEDDDEIVEHVGPMSEDESI